MSFSFRVLLESVGDRDCSVAQVLTVHGLNGCIAGIKTGEVDEGKAFRVSCVRIPHDLRCLQNHTKCTEDIVQQFLVNFWVQVSNEDIGTDIQVLGVRGCLEGREGIDRGRERGREGVGGKGGRGERERGRRKRGGKGKREGGKDGGGRRENGRE